MPGIWNMEEASLHLKQVKREAGFTIIETIIAISILAVGLLAVANMQIMAVKGNTSAGWQAEQTVHAQDKMEELMALAYTHADLDPAGNTHNEANPPTNFTITWDVLNNTPVPNTKLITITVAGLNKTTVLTGVKPNF